LLGCRLQQRDGMGSIISHGFAGQIQSRQIDIALGENSRSPLDSYGSGAAKAGPTAADRARSAITCRSLVSPPLS
jgi:hypothetical protein